MRGTAAEPRHFLRNKEPKARAELFLAVGFGSLVEEEEERGIAHIIEHLGLLAASTARG